MNPFKYGPRYAALSELPLAERVAQMRRDEVRAAILAEAPDSNRASTTLDRIPAPLFEHLFPLGDELEYEPTPDQSVASLAARTGSIRGRSCTTCCSVPTVAVPAPPVLNYGRGSYDGLHDMMLDPPSVQGLGDGGAHWSVVCDASMTTYMLTHWVRDRSRGPRLPLEYAVKRLTADAAALYGLGDRGVLAPGMRATST